MTNDKTKLQEKRIAEAGIKYLERLQKLVDLALEDNLSSPKLRIGVVGEVSGAIGYFSAILEWLKEDDEK